MYAEDLSESMQLMEWVWQRDDRALRNLGRYEYFIRGSEARAGKDSLFKRKKQKNLDNNDFHSQLDMIRWFHPSRSFTLFT
ncbi:hypothetical protein U9M73_00185 [Paenibacillus phoenicis]|uniref:Uncharacterized protein n=1 Tax=Paenibacillus phoenicis TaxID=554117 RepID=A0ABU5PER7_9BACL|nr:MULTISPECIES: hypothetical protein [Paenibacillus]MCT2193608.1 hypothetical protein [Paenibacillus sp. p3-SID1389]MEA3568416.1 hypothetical protein [Paenibacillus phoenicis]